MTSRQPRTVKTSETVKILEQVVQKMTFEQPETDETSKTVEITESFEIAGVYTPTLSYI